MSSATFGLSHQDDEVLPDPPAPVSMPCTLSVFEINMSCFVTTWIEDKTVMNIYTLHVQDWSHNMDM